MAEKFLTLKEVLARTSLSRSHTYRLIAEGTFPKSVALGARRMWLESEIIEWQNARIAEREAA